LPHIFYFLCYIINVYNLSFHILGEESDSVLSDHKVSNDEEPRIESREQSKPVASDHETGSDELEEQRKQTPSKLINILWWIRWWFNS